MISRLTRILTVAALALAAAVLATGAVAASHGGAVVKLGHNGLGRVLADSHGRTLYLWAHDKHHKSTCSGAAPSTGRPSPPRASRRRSAEPARHF